MGYLSRGGLCLLRTGYDSGKFHFGMCDTIAKTSGDFFVVAMSTSAGWAVISGGQPSITAPDGQSGYSYCMTDSGFYDSGLWILTHAAHPSETVVTDALAAAAGWGFDTRVLRNVSHMGCNYH